MNPHDLGWTECNFADQPAPRRNWDNWISVGIVVFMFLVNLRMK